MNAQNLNFAPKCSQNKCFSLKFCIHGRKIADKKIFGQFSDSPKFTPFLSPRPLRHCTSYLLVGSVILRLHNRANIEQTSSKRPANIKQI